MDAFKAQLSPPPISQYDSKDLYHPLVDFRADLDLLPPTPVIGCAPLLAIQDESVSTCFCRDVEGTLSVDNATAEYISRHASLRDIPIDVAISAFNCVRHLASGPIIPLEEYMEDILATILETQGEWAATVTRDEDLFPLDGLIRTFTRYLAPAWYACMRREYEERTDPQRAQP